MKNDSFKNLILSKNQNLWEYGETVFCFMVVSSLLFVETIRRLHWYVASPHLELFSGPLSEVCHVY